MLLASETILSCQPEESTAVKYVSLVFPHQHCMIATELFTFQGANFLVCEECCLSHLCRDLDCSQKKTLIFLDSLFYCSSCQYLIAWPYNYLYISMLSRPRFFKNARFTSAVITVSGNVILGNDNIQHRTLLGFYSIGFLACEQYFYPMSLFTFLCPNMFLFLF